MATVPNKPMPPMARKKTTIRRKQSQGSPSMVLIAIIVALSAFALAVVLTLAGALMPVLKGIELSLRGIRKGLGVKEDGTS